MTRQYSHSYFDTYFARLKKCSTVLDVQGVAGQNNQSQNNQGQNSQCQNIQYAKIANAKIAKTKIANAI